MTLDEISHEAPPTEHLLNLLPSTKAAVQLGTLGGGKPLSRSLSGTNSSLLLASLRLVKIKRECYTLRAHLVVFLSVGREFTSLAAMQVIISLR